MDKIFDFHGAVVLQTNRCRFTPHFPILSSWMSPCSCINLTSVQGISVGVQPQADPSQWNGGYYGYAYGHEGYGYAPAPQDPNMYGYPYGNYQQQAQQQQAGYSWEFWPSFVAFACSFYLINKISKILFGATLEPFLAFLSKPFETFSCPMTYSLTDVVFLMKFCYFKLYVIAIVVVLVWILFPYIYILAYGGMSCFWRSEPLKTVSQ